MEVMVYDNFIALAIDSFFISYVLKIKISTVILTTVPSNALLKGVEVGLSVQSLNRQPSNQKHSSLTFGHFLPQPSC